ncbi:MAG TPA: hypothetical protein VHV83_05640 [Armatimonadota bacterium]|nr:hypothetical protein [Armatimonadota bacterium]
MMQTYKTNDLANAVGLHINTIRLYERIGFLSPATRALRTAIVSSVKFTFSNSTYVDQFFRCQRLGRELHAASLQVIRAMAAWKLPNAVKLARCYHHMISAEYEQAKSTARILADW